MKKGDLIRLRLEGATPLIERLIAGQGPLWVVTYTDWSEKAIIAKALATGFETHFYMQEFEHEEG